MSENLNEESNIPLSEGESGEEVKKDIQGLFGSTKKFLSELLDIRKNTDQEATKEAIIADIPFKGHTSWILICYCFGRVKCQFDCCCHWSHVNFSFNGANLGYWSVFSRQ